MGMNVFELIRVETEERNQAKVGDVWYCFHGRNRAKHRTVTVTKVQARTIHLSDGVKIRKSDGKIQGEPDSYMHYHPMMEYYTQQIQAELGSLNVQERFEALQERLRRVKAREEDLSEVIEQLTSAFDKLGI